MQVDELITALIDGDQHRGGLRCLRLFTLRASFVECLAQEVEQFCRLKLASDVAKPGHVTRWTQPRGEVTQYSLLNSSGNTEDFNNDHDLSCKGKWFFDQDSFPRLGELIACWPHLINFRINILGPRAALQAHKEHIAFRTVAGGIGARLRFHLPVATNVDARLTLDGGVFHLPSGEISLINQGCVHSATNGGDHRRIHLVWDALLTDQLYRFLFENERSPEFFDDITAKPYAPIQQQRIDSYVRMPSAVDQSELADLQLCAPQ